MEWIAPDLTISNALLPRILSILVDLQADPHCSFFASELEALKGMLYMHSLRSVAEVDRAIEQLFSLSLKAGRISQAMWMEQVERLREQWRLRVTDLDQSIPGVRAAAPATASSSASAAAVSGSEDWIAPDLAITEAIGRQIAGILADFQDDVGLCEIASDLAAIEDAVLRKSLRSVAEVDRAVDLVFSSEIRISWSVGLTPRFLEDSRRLWRTRITKLVERSRVRPCPLSIRQRPHRNQSRSLRPRLQRLSPRCRLPLPLRPPAWLLMSRLPRLLPPPVRMSGPSPTSRSPTRSVPAS